MLYWSVNFHMKTLILSLALAGGAAGQGYIPCLIDKAPPGFNATMRVDTPGADTAPIRMHQADWKLRSATSSIFAVNHGTAQSVLISMPAAGTCSGTFDSADNRDDLTKVATEYGAKQARVTPPQINGDIEIFVVDEAGWREFAAGRNYQMYGSTGRSAGGKFSFDLPAGLFRLVINNRYSTFASKWVRLTVGEGPTASDGTAPAVTITRDRQ
jgi:hypothetical protein